ncbi:MAG: hypothetical protein NDI84_10745 [Steroidobacteraceae bacterium]|nr:hypothetical protein [Steroidobacteraceae bacterium]
MNQTYRPGTASRVVALVALAAVLAACGRGEDETAAKTGAPAANGAPAEGTAAPPAESPDDKRMATAVVTGKTSAPVDLKYDVLAKPNVGQPVEVELVLLPRLAADTLEVEVTGIPGLTVVSGGAIKFEGVAGGDRHVAKVIVQADAPGIYYVNVVARMSTKVQTEVRTFSVPVVVGAVPAARKAEPQQDAAGEAIQSMPAAESGGAEEPAKTEPGQ